MPTVSTFYCDNDGCGFEGPAGRGYYMYAVADDGERIECPSPGELSRAREVIGPDAPEAELDERTGFNYHCACVDCAAVCDLDPTRDPMTCPECGSRAIARTVDLVGSKCPECGEGTFTEGDAGAIA